MSEGDIEMLACAVGVSDDELASIQSKFKKQKAQVFQLLSRWHSETNESKQTLCDILTATGYHRAVKK